MEKEPSVICHSSIPNDAGFPIGIVFSIVFEPSIELSCDRKGSFALANGRLHRIRPKQSSHRGRTLAYEKVRQGARIGF